MESDVDSLDYGERYSGGIAASVDQAGAAHRSGVCPSIEGGMAGGALLGLSAIRLVAFDDRAAG